VPEHPGDDFKVKCVGTSRYNERAKLFDFAGFNQPSPCRSGLLVQHHNPGLYA
jgi:hypothetical protein